MAEMIEVEKILREWAENVITQIQENLDSTGTTASGKTKESLRYETESDEYGGKLVIYGRPYFQGVEDGRPAGGIPYKFQDILYQWMLDKGIEGNFGNTESEQRSAAFLVGQFIKHHGTKLYNEGGRMDIYTNVFNEEIPKLEDEITFRVKRTIYEFMDLNK